MMLILATTTILLSSFMTTTTSAQLVEAERMVEYEKRGYTWPLDHYVPNTDGWKHLMEERFAQIAEMDATGSRYEGYLQTVNSAYVVQNFTQYGFGLAKCPTELLKALQNGIRDGLPNARLEHGVDVIEAPEPPLFVDRPDLTYRVLHELKSYVEAWAGVKVVPYRAYGFRLYQNQSKLHMHVDKAQTHILSFILHIDSETDEPWPIYIESFEGKTYEAILKPGDMLFYESSKCFHGRPKPLNGKWYSSIFVHYYPEGNWQAIDHKLEANYAVPPVWKQPAPASKTHVPLKMVGTSMKEPNCPNDWCRIQNAVKFNIPSEEGYWIAPNFKKYPLNINSMNDEL